MGFHYYRDHNSITIRHTGAAGTMAVTVSSTLSLQLGLVIDVRDVGVREAASDFGELPVAGRGGGGGGAGGGGRGVGLLAGDDVQGLDAVFAACRLVSPLHQGEGAGGTQGQSLR